MKIFQKILPIIAIISAIGCQNPNNPETVLSDNPNITTFAVQNDSFPSIKRIAFTINNDSNLIFNVDSLPFGTNLAKLRPTIYGNALKRIVLNDTIVYTGNDTIDFSRPVSIATTAADGKTTKTYIVRVHAYKIDPDLYNWSEVCAEIFDDLDVVQQHAIWHADEIRLFVKSASEITLFTSKNGREWKRQTVNYLPTDVDLQTIVAKNGKLLIISDFQLYESGDGIDWAMAKTTLPVEESLFGMDDEIFAWNKIDGKRTLFASSNLAEWDTLATLPTNFPVSDYALAVDEAPSGKLRVYFAGGKSSNGTILNTIWSSENGNYWVDLTAEKGQLKPRFGTAMIQYAKGLLLIGGADNNGECTDRLLYSPDYGLSWRNVEAKATLPENWKSRHGHSVVVTPENEIVIIGGKVGELTLSDVWTGRKNSEK